jgi:hypothetical protein
MHVRPMSSHDLNGGRVMNVSRWLVLALFAAGCSNAPESERASAPASSEPVATSGQQDHTLAAEPAKPDVAAPAPQKKDVKVRPVIETVAARDARAAAKGPVTQATQEQGVNADGAILADFNARVKKYVDIHKDAAKGSAKLKQTENPGEITAAQDALAAKIRVARSTAKQGDIFTAEIRDRFRRLLAPELKGEDGRDARAVLKEDAPPPSAIPFKVNAKYPEGQPLPSVPANLLLNLPTLPEPLEYRIVGKHLLLLDTGANIIVDYIPNAIS